MRRIRLSAPAAALALLAACSQTPQMAAVSDAAADLPVASTPAAGEWLDDVAAVSAATDNAGRRRVIEQQLDTLGLQWRHGRFETDEGPGENILATVSGPDGAPLLLLGAHSDRVATGRGATDNASGSATVLALAERFQREPLQHHRVAIAFWDQEEDGLLGSGAYIENGGDKPALYVNFDVFGWGDTLWMMAPAADAPLATASRAAATDAGLSLSAGEHYPPTDHRAFLKAGWPAVSYSLVGAGEVPLILQMYAGKQPESLPKVMQVIHHDRDTLAEIDPDAAVRGVDAVEDALRRWDAAAVGG